MLETQTRETLREQLHSKFTSVTSENSVRGVQMKHVLKKRILMIGQQRLKRKHENSHERSANVLIVKHVRHIQSVDRQFHEYH
jgi:hypothetical protein